MRWKRERTRPRFGSVYVVVHEGTGSLVLVDSLYWDREDAEARRAQVGGDWEVVQWDVD